ncbi:MAG: protoporphyrinogen oxidase HemJ [Pseudomonadota bacterium]
MSYLIDIIADHYLLIKFFHLLAVFCWMAGLFYLPRIFVYHVESTNEESKRTLDVMAEKLYRCIMTPAMHASLLFGGLLFLLPQNRIAGWMHLKLTCVLALVVFQLYLNRCRLTLAIRVPFKSGRFFRLINEIPTIALIIILICVVFKSF